MLTLHLFLKKDSGVLKKTTNQWVFCLSSPKFSKNYYPTKWRLSWISFCLSTIVAFEYGCSFVAKLSSKNICFFYKIYIICRKKCFYLEKKFYNEKNILLKKNFFYMWKYKWKCKNICLISEMYFYTENVCVTNKL